MDVVAGNSRAWPESQPEIERDGLEHKPPAILIRPFIPEKKEHSPEKLGT